MEPLPQKDVCQEPVFQELFFAHARHVRNFLYYKGANASESEDLMQEAFLRMWRDCAKVPFEKARGFLFAVAGNLFLDAKKHEQVVLRFQRLQPVETQEDETPQFQLETRELQDRLEKAIAQLPENQRIVFLMNRMDKMTYADIADHLDLSVKAVEKRMSKALVELRQILKGI
ncbi:MAG: RNA polymerase sigma factor [Lewinellaceae bacterium]|nr:RNA polymerase sigma factor [Saprospiraceae bacterium]MCB9341889.1 RNA polymerase sigma factor [Lewinellaceae bacterium]